MGGTSATMAASSSSSAQCSEVDVYNPLDTDSWARIVSFVPLVHWTKIVALNGDVKIAVLRAAHGDPYCTSELDVNLTSRSVELACIFVAMKHLRFPSLRLRGNPDQMLNTTLDSHGNLDQLMIKILLWQGKLLPASLQVLTLCDGAWQLVQSPDVFHNIKALIVLDIVYLDENRGRVLCDFLSAGLLCNLRKLKAGCPEHGFNTVGSRCPGYDGVIEHVPDLASATPKLETLDIRYSRSVAGLDINACRDLFCYCSTLRHLDLTMVMTWRDFNPVLTLLAENLPDLESLAAGGGLVSHGLSMSLETLNEFLTALSRSLKNLQLQSCSIQPFSVPVFHECLLLRRLNLGGTLLLFENFGLSSHPFGQWLQQVGRNLLEFIVMGAILAEEEMTDAEFVSAVHACQEFCRTCCSNIEDESLFFAQFTAVNDTPRLRKGIPTHVSKLHELSATLALFPFLDRVHSESCRVSRRISASDISS